jgi:hypothetical protein
MSGMCQNALGGSCNANKDCETGYCSMLNRMCGRPIDLPNGEACSQDSQCVSGSCGWEHLCASLAARLRNCDSDADCTGNLMCYRSDNADDIGYCEDSANIDTRPTCTFDSECTTGSCSWDDHCDQPAGELHNCNSAPDCLSGLICGPDGYCVRTS